MGLLGWELLAANTELHGTVVAGTPTETITTFYDADGDWCIGVTPDAAYMHLVQLPGKGVGDHCNKFGVIECEIRPPDGQCTQPMFNAYCTGLVGKHVKITGPWVNDTSHGVKTEIHPIHALRTLEPTAGTAPGSWRYEIMVISATYRPTDLDHPLTGPFAPQESDRDEHYDEDLPLPAAVDPQATVPYARLLQTSGTSYKLATATINADGQTAHLHVETGTDPRGFFSGALELGHEHPSCADYWAQAKALTGEIQALQSELQTAPKEEWRILTKEIHAKKADQDKVIAAARADGCGYPPPGTL